MANLRAGRPRKLQTDVVIDGYLALPLEDRAPESQPALELGERLVEDNAALKEGL